MAEVRINLKKKMKNGEPYYIGNCDMEVNLADTVLMLYPSNDEQSATLVIKTYNPDLRNNNRNDDED